MTTNINTVNDARVWLRPRTGDEINVWGLGYNSPSNDFENVLQPLIDMGGLVFPYRPNISIQGGYEVENNPLQLSAQDYQSYKKSKLPTIQLSGMFTSQNTEQARYALAVIHFMKTITKMHFGDAAAANYSYSNGSSSSTLNNIGNPPPKLILDGNGSLIFNKVPVIISNYSIELAQDTLYVEVDLAVSSTTKKTTLVPTKFNVVTNLIPQIPPAKWLYNSTNPTRKKVFSDSERFNWDNFANGSLFKNGGWM